MVTSKPLAMCILALMLGFSPVANAGLINNGGGLIYDTDLNITWYDAAPVLRTWNDSVTWAANLIMTVNGKSYTDWRLPTTVEKFVDGEYVWGYDGTTTAGYNITTSEMGHLFYTELGNKGEYALDGSHPQPGSGLTNKGFFTNLQPDRYWSGTEFSLGTIYAWRLVFWDGNSGEQDRVSKDGYGYALAVHDGNVPEPATICLLGLGALSLLRRKR